MCCNEYHQYILCLGTTNIYSLGYPGATNITWFGTLVPHSVSIPLKTHSSIATKYMYFS